MPGFNKYIYIVFIILCQKNLFLWNIYSILPNRSSIKFYVYIRARLLTRPIKIFYIYWSEQVSTPDFTLTQNLMHFQHKVYGILDRHWNTLFLPKHLTRLSYVVIVLIKKSNNFENQTDKMYSWKHLDPTSNEQNTILKLWYSVRTNESVKQMVKWKLPLIQNKKMTVKYDI